MDLLRSPDPHGSGVSRRAFLRRAATGVGVAAGLGAGLGAVPASLVAAASPRSGLYPASRGVVVRRDVAALAPDDDSLVMLREAVGVLKARSERNPLDPQGWIAHANLHSLFCATNSFREQVHYSWLVLPWHRAYLLALEKQLQAAINEPTLALHYWDWSQRPQMPSAYFGAGNPLADGTRLQRAEDTIPTDFLNTGAVLRAPTFSSFGGFPKDALATDPLVEGILEQSCHNNVHNWIGGNMASFTDSGYDPLFYTHHGNVDRMWDAWLAAGPGRENPADRRWLDTVFRFIGPTGALTSISVAELVDTEALGYRFESLDFGNPAADAGMPAHAGRPLLQAPVSASDGARGRALDAIGGAAGGDGRRRALLQFTRVQLVAMPLSIRVFLDNPGPVDADVTAPSFVGTFTMLPVGRPDSSLVSERVTIQMELGPDQARLLESDAPVRVSLLPVQLRGRTLPSTSVVLEDVTLTLDA